VEGEVVAGDADGRSECQLVGADVLVVDVAAGHQVLDVGVVDHVGNEERVDLGGRSRRNDHADALGSSLVAEDLDLKGCQVAAVDGH
jgi:hypothetical protein